MVLHQGTSLCHRSIPHRCGDDNEQQLVAAYGELVERLVDEPITLKQLEREALKKLEQKD
jgi:hypothetical protein